MKDTNYAFCVARVRALENKLLSKSDISALINQKDYMSAVDFLEKKGYSCQSGDSEKIITDELERLYENLNDSAPDKNELSDLYILNDYFNIKALVKCAVSSFDPNGLFAYPTTIELSNVDKNSLSSFSFLKDEYKRVALEAYDITVKSQNGKFCDMIVDKAAINSLYACYKRKHSGLLGEISAFTADTANIKIAFRGTLTHQNEDYLTQAVGECCKINREKLIKSAVSGKDELVSYLSSTDYKSGALIFAEKMEDFEKWCDDEIIKTVKSAVYKSFGFDPIVSYFYRKSLEIKTVRLVLNALKSHIDTQMIKERVRELYA